MQGDREIRATEKMIRTGVIERREQGNHKLKRFNIREFAVRD